MNTDKAQGFLQEMQKMGGASLVLGSMLGGAALAAGGHKLYKGYKQKKLQNKMQQGQRARENRFGQLTPRMDPRML